MALELSLRKTIIMIHMIALGCAIFIHFCLGTQPVFLGFPVFVIGSLCLANVFFVSRELRLYREEILKQIKERDVEPDSLMLDIRKDL